MMYTGFHFSWMREIAIHCFAEYDPMIVLNGHPTKRADKKAGSL